jgi:cytochrome c oxidase subunit 2
MSWQGKEVQAMSTSAVVVNGSLIYILAIAVLCFILILFFMVYFLVRYRHARNPVPEEIPGNPILETIWVVVPTIIMLTMFYYGLTGFNFLRRSPANSLNVKVHSRQWSWLFEYENGKKSPDLVIPLGRNIRCELTSDDVIHGFYIPAFRIQQDALPGFKTAVWFNSTATGTYDILCSQYCGLHHSAMLAKLVVVTPDDFDEWLAGKSPALPGRAQKRGMPAGYDLFTQRGCLSCHSIEGVPMTGPPLNGIFGRKVRVITDGKLREITADEEYLMKHIMEPGKDVAEGYPNIMPSGTNVMSKQEISEVVKYLESLK